MSKPMLACGHAANARDRDGNPTCAICIGISSGASVVVHTPSLSGREARCAYCGAAQPSNTDLAFFEFHGEGSENARKMCKNCGYYKTAHDAGKCDDCVGFEPHGAYDHDSYYCGCRGWD